MNSNFTNFLDNDTKKVCMTTFIAMFLLLVFVVGPLSSFTMASTIVKIFVLIILMYSIYLNLKQTNILNTMTRENNTNEYNAQLKLNIVCSYVFTLFLGVLILFILKTFL